jgi:hypothetical protein
MASRQISSRLAAGSSLMPPSSSRAVTRFFDISRARRIVIVPDEPPS